MTGPHEDDQVHPGWSAQPQESYDSGHSGGWGAPGASQAGDTGPLRLPQRDDQPGVSGPRGQDADGRGPAQTGSVGGPGQGAGPGMPPSGYDQAAYAQAAPWGYAPQGGRPYADASGSYAPASPGYDPYGSTPPWQTPPARSRGLASMVDFTFATRATRALAPVLFWLVLAWGLATVVSILVSLTSGPYGPGGGVVFTRGLEAVLDTAVKVVLARLFLELCVNVADVAERAGQGR